MPHYSQTLDLDMLNHRYWSRRMQQCKAEFRASHSRHSPSPSPTSSTRNAPFSSASGRSRPVSDRSNSSSASFGSSPRGTSVRPQHADQPSLPNEAVSHKERPVSASKPSRPVKYQVR